MKCTFKRLALLAATMVSTAALLSGCGGSSDGATGTAGAPGAPGAAGAPGVTGTVTTGTCAVCHSSGRIADASYIAPTGVHYKAKPLQLAVTGVSTVVDATTTPPTFVTTFTPTADAALTSYGTSALATSSPGTTVTLADGSSYTSPATLKYLSFVYARLSAPTSAATSPQWVRYLTKTQKSTSASSLGQITYSSSDNVAANLTKNADGSYTMRSQIPAGSGSETEYDASKPTRLLLLVAGIKNTAGAFTTVPQNVVTTPDFVPDGSVSTLQRDLVAEAACDSCHANLQMDGSFNGVSGIHGGARYKVAACVVCHTDTAYTKAITNATTKTLNGVSTGRVMQTLIHQIHNAVNAKLVGGSDDWSGVTYPQPVTNCVKCHVAPAVNADNWKNLPTAAACGTCHTAVNFTTGAGHAGGAQPDANCNVCHPATGHMNVQTGASVTDAHDVSATSTLHANAQNVPEFDVTMTPSAPKSGAFYVTGETPTITVTLKKHSDGTAVPGTLYTAASHKAGTAAGTSLSKAVLYVYGPRANALPVLTKAAVTLSAAGVPGQSVSLLLPSTDTQVTTTTSGFSYKLSAITAKMVGTYMIRSIAADYGYVADTNYKIDSTAFQPIQINTATVDKKIDGNACVNCHGAGTLGAHDARHSVAFDTDQCVACHDRSGNHGDTIANRVHAVHEASVKGDLLVIDWSAVTYPQDTNRCITCHTGGQEFTKTSIFEGTCYGCHADQQGAIGHFQTNGGI